MKKSSLRNLRFILIAIIAILFTVSVYAQEDALKKIKEIDSKMYKGNVEYFWVDYTDNAKITYVSLKYDGKRCIARDISSTNNVFNGVITQTAYIDFGGFSYQEKNLFGCDADPRFFCPITNAPSTGYGRGLSFLKDAKYNPTKKEVSGFVVSGYKDKYYIVAKVEPELGYLASKIYGYSPDKKILLRVIENKNPMLVDKKYYVYRNSVSINDKGGIYSFRTVKATFKTPLITNDEFKNKLNNKNKYVSMKYILGFKDSLTKRQVKEVASNFSPSQEKTIMSINENIKFYNPYEYLYVYIILIVFIIGLILYLMKRNRD